MEKIADTKTCKNCAQPFNIMENDRAFYAEMKVPDPTHCPPCRNQRRLANRNERFLYHRTCDLTGTKMISSISTDKPFPVYDNDAWWEDGWDALDYGVDFDFSRPFFEQFFELRNRVPRLARQQQKPIWNSDYCNCVSQNKNCYLVFSTNRCEDCCYGSWVNESKSCVDNQNIIHCELCYECFNCRNCYRLFYSQDSENCKNSYFLRNCRGCNHCYGCHNLINREYCIFNKQYTKEEYETLIEKANLGSFKHREVRRKEAEAFNRDIVMKSFYGTNLENSEGNYLRNCKNAYHCFECDDSEDIRYSMCIEKAKSSMDHSHWGGKTERIYECQACGYDLFQMRFCNLCWSGCSNLTYCDHCFSSQNSFGCVGLRKNNYCIFNKQYTRDEYIELARKIIEHMKETGEWGEFFPVSQSSYCYNETLAHERFPMTREQVLAKGWQWKDPKEQVRKNNETEIPDHIADVTDKFLQTIITCTECNKQFKMAPKEFVFYREQGVPIPRACPDCRHDRRRKQKNPQQFWERECNRCHTEIKTTYAPERPEKICCEKCYFAEVY